MPGQQLCLVGRGAAPFMDRSRRRHKPCVISMLGKPQTKIRILNEHEKALVKTSELLKRLAFHQQAGRRGSIDSNWLRIIW